MDRSDAERYFNQPAGVSRLFAGLLLAPAAFAVQFGANYALVPWLCGRGSGAAPLFIVSALGLAVAALGLWLAWRNWRDAGRGWRATGSDVIDRTRFLAVTGMLLSGYVTAIMLLQFAMSAGTEMCA